MGWGEFITLCLQKQVTRSQEYICIYTYCIHMYFLTIVVVAVVVAGVVVVAVVVVLPTSSCCSCCTGIRLCNLVLGEVSPLAFHIRRKHVRRRQHVTAYPREANMPVRQSCTNKPS